MNRATRSTSVPRRRHRKSTPLSRKKPARIEDPEDTWYQIKDIVDEKYEKGKLWYKIDWADNPATGEPYEQSWIPAEDANEDAVEDWNREKRRRAYTEPPSQGSSFDTRSDKDEQVVGPNQKRRLSTPSDSRARRKQKRLRTVVESDRSSPPDEPNDSWSREAAQSISRETAGNRKLIVELKTRPDFDPTEYTAISSSQLSHEIFSQTHNGLEGVPGHKSAADISQRTIADSQGLSASVFSCESAKEPSDNHHSSQIGRTDATQPRDLSPRYHATSTSSDIPSRQLDRFAPFVASQPTSQHSATSPRSANQNAPQASLRRLPGSPSTTSQEKQPGQPTGDEFTGFLTQPEFIINNPFTSSSGSAIATSNPLVAESDHQPSNKTVNENVAQDIRDTIIDNSQQYAQIIPRSTSASKSQTQSHGDPAVSSEDQVIPETTQKRVCRSRSPRSHPDQPRYDPDHILESIEEGFTDIEDHSRPTTSASIASVRTLRGYLRTGTQELPGRESSEMESSTATGTPTSMVERLRQIQAEALNRGSENTRQNDPADAQRQASEVDQPMTSPSAVLPSVEPDHSPINPHEQYQEPQSEGWPASRPGPTTELEQSSTQVGGPDSSSTELPPLPPNDFQPGLGINLDFPGPDLGLVEQPLDQEAIPATIAPSVLNTNAETELFPSSALPVVGHGVSQSGTLENAVAGILPLVSSHESSPDSDNGASFPEQILRESEIAGQNEQIITLPLAANLRHVYLEILARNEPVMEAFTQVFAEDVYRLPDESLVMKVDDMLRRLYDLCDLPASQEDIPLSTAEDMMKYARDTNSKFLFVYELLEGLRDVDQQVLILARPGRVTEFLEALLSARRFNYRRLDGLETHQANPDEPLRVILAPTNSSASDLRGDVGVVIAFDETSRSSGLLTAYQTRDSEEVGPVVLSLVVTHSVEHIDLRISRSMDPMERKNALVVSVVQARDLIAEPERGYPEPHAVAETFAQLIKDPTVEIFYEQQAIPDEVFEVYMSSQAQGRATQRSPVPPDVNSDRSTSRKRQLDDVGSGTGTPKRVRMAESLRRSIEPRAQISDVLRQLLGNQVTLNGGSAEVPIERLEFLASKITDLEYRLKQKISVEDTIREELKSLTTQLRSYERTVKKIQPKYMDALRDRGTFEAQRDTAVEEAKTMKTLLETSRATVATLKEDKKSLEAKLSEATTALKESSVPEVARLAQAEDQLKAEQKKVQSLEKRLSSVQKDMEYIQNAYQTASSKGASLANETKELSARVKELEQQASENLVKVHQVNAQVESQGFRQLWEDEQAIRRHREAELERIREELRVLRNGRRETRQASVPRSPRLGMMSPRNGRGAGPGSRGTSPAPMGNFDAAGPMPGMTYFGQPPGNGRFSHLRE